MSACIYGEQQYKFTALETPRKFIIAKLSFSELGASSVLKIVPLLKLINTRANGSNALLQWIYAVFPQNYAYKDRVSDVFIHYEKCYFKK